MTCTEISIVLSAFSLVPLPVTSLAYAKTLSTQELAQLQRRPHNWRLAGKYNSTHWLCNPQSFWANEAVFQMMMLSYNLFFLFKFDSLSISEYRQQIKTFRLKYMFLAAKIIKTARYVVMKLSAKYSYKDVYERCLS